MFTLDTTSKSVTAEMSGAAATTNPTFSCDYRIMPANQRVNLTGSLNGVTEVDVCPAPQVAGLWHEIDSITIYNIDTAAVTVYLELEDGASEYRQLGETLAVGETLLLTPHG